MFAILRLSLALLSVTVVGCGWHLRGTGEMTGNIRHIFVEQSRSPLVSTALYNEIFHRGLKWEATRKAAEVIVKLEDEHFERRILSVDPATGKVREVELILTTHFSVRSAGGKILIPREPLVWQLDYVFDEGALLGTVEQDSAIQLDLSNTAATSLMFRVASIKLPPDELVPAAQDKHEPKHSDKSKAKEQAG